jgi:uncharacterized membrane protein HdeD (DUF308 family)
MALVFAFGLYAISDGVYTLGAAFRHADEGERPWLGLFVSGFASVFAGWIALFSMHVTPVGLAYLIAAWAVVKGAMAIIAALQLRKHMIEETLMGFSGVVSVLFGISIAAFPANGPLGAILWIGSYAVIYGLLMIALGAKLRTWMRPGLTEFEHRISHGVAHYCLSDDPT